MTHTMRAARVQLPAISTASRRAAERWSPPRSLTVIARRTVGVEPKPRLASVSETPVRQLHGAAMMLSASVLIDSAIEHYRGSFHNKAMYMPLAASICSLLAGAQGALAGKIESDRARSLAYGGAVAVGAIGAGFHVYNVGKRVGGWRWENLFYGAPLGAPAALTLSGLTGLAADRIPASEKRDGEAKLLGFPAGRALAALASVGLLGTVGEAGLLHFRGNFQNPAMYLPVTIPVAAAAVTADAALRPEKRDRRAAKFWLGLTSVMGMAGAALHAYGVSRGMGGWRNWRQNLVDGPPIPAPPSFSALALVGLAALTLLEGSRRK